MANYVRISAIGAAGVQRPGGAGGQAVEGMIEHWRQKFEKVLPDRPDLIVVPEACDSYMEHVGRPELLREYCQARGEKVRDFFAAVAKRHSCYITYPAFRILPDGTYRNSVQLIDRNGQIVGIYDKNHPTFGEFECGILAGVDAPLFECDFGRVGCAICFDLNFDELRRRYAEQRPDLILFTSMYHGGLMQKYWAYSCRAHLAGAVAGLPSAVICPVGEVLASTTNYYDYVTTTVNLDCCVVHLDQNWERLDALKRKYGPEVSIFDPGLLAPVLITSESESRTVEEMVAEFEIELLDDYLDRSRQARQRHSGPAAAP